MSDDARRDRTMPVWIAVGVIAVLAGAVLDGPIRLVLWVVGLCALAYGIGQYLGPRRR